MSYITSSELHKTGDKNYLRIFLKPEFSYSIKADGEDQSFVELLFEEPNTSDISQLKDLGIAIEKLASYDSIKSIRIANTFSKESLELLRGQQEEETKELSDESKSEPTNEENILFSRLFISDLLIRSADFQNDETDYFKELQKFINFVNSKSKRDINGIFANNDLSVFDKYNAKSIFIKEELIIEYVSFFFDHFPSRSLHMSLK